MPAVGRPAEMVAPAISDDEAGVRVRPVDGASGSDAQRSLRGDAVRSDPSADPTASKQRKRTGSLEPDDQTRVAALRARDAQVKLHERMHQAIAGALAGAASFTYERGPDGQLYAVGGEVPIDLSPGKTPKETIDRARTIRAAALAPADPSGADRAVAAAAAAMELEAQREQRAEDELRPQGQDGAKGGPKAAGAVDGRDAEDAGKEPKLAIVGSGSTTPEGDPVKTRDAERQARRERIQAAERASEAANARRELLASLKVIGSGDEPNAGPEARIQIAELKLVGSGSTELKVVPPIIGTKEGATGLSLPGSGDFLEVDSVRPRGGGPRVVDLLRPEFDKAENSNAAPDSDRRGASAYAREERGTSERTLALVV
jgi:hypothetical protein